VLIKIICGQMEIIPGRPDLNYQKISNIIGQAKEKNADILLLPEMCLPGYLIGDLWEQQTFLDDCAYYAKQIAAQAENLCIVFGSVATEKGKINEDGRIRKYNAAYICQNGAMLSGYLERNFIIKNSLPNYREFDDARYFHSLQKLCAEENIAIADALQPIAITINGQQIKLGVMLCEDGWTDNYQYNIPSILAEKEANLLCNLSCSPYSLGKNKKRHRLLAAQSQAASKPLIYCNNVGIQNNGKNIFTYDGSSCVYNASGKLAAALPMFTDELLEFTWNTETNEINSANLPAAPQQETDIIYHTLRYGTQQFLKQCGINKMTIGLSGGIDSAVTAAMYTDILGPENVLLLNLPSRYNSEATKNIAQRLAKKLHTNYAVMPITESCQHTEKQLTSTPVTNFSSNTTFNLELSRLQRENIQARDRGARLIAAAAAAFGGAFSCNSNKSEIAIGYATFYGDICGALAMIGDIWKHQVYALGHYLNDEIFKDEVIPNEIFTIRPSAELSEEQTVGVGGDPLVYEYHDYLFKAFMERWHKITPADILRWYKNNTFAAELGCSDKIIQDTFPNNHAFVADLERWWKLFSGFAVAKRIQAPPILSLSKRSFGYDHREAQLTPYFSREYYQLKEELLS
jgi:NAD+ synthase (glutamine-hydrolysing)